MSDLFQQPPRAPRPYREGLRHEKATQTRNAAYREHKASGTAATQRDELLRAYADPRVVAKGYTDLSDREAGLIVGIPPNTVSARRKELLTAEGGPLVETRELLPCPFCGHRNPDPQVTTDYTGKPHYYVACPSCACEGPWGKTASLGRRYWNERAATVNGVVGCESRLPDRTAAIERALDDIDTLAEGFAERARLAGEAGHGTSAANFTGRAEAYMDAARRVREAIEGR